MTEECINVSSCKLESLGVWLDEEAARSPEGETKGDAAAIALEIISGMMSASLICKYSTDTNAKYGIMCMSFASVPVSTSTMADDPCGVT